MCDFVLERFPERSQLISQLFQEDADFEEMCADYEELATWLDANDQEGGRPEAECVEARRVLESLEVEIIRKLQSVPGGATSKNRTMNNPSEPDSP